MTTYNNLPVYKKSYDFLLELFRVSNRNLEARLPKKGFQKKASKKRLPKKGFQKKASKNNMKRLKFETGQLYHIYNRGTDKREIFSDNFDYERFLLSLKEFNDVEPTYSLYLKSMKDAHFRRPTSKALDVGRLKTPLVEIIAYSLLPNHFHLLVKQKEDGGISELMKRVGGGYTKFYNNKHDRPGSLFQGKFKSVHVDSQNYLEYLSAYINGNPVIHKIDKVDKVDKVDNYKWSSYQYYLGGKESDILVNKKVILKNFKNIDEYKKFTNDVIKNSQERKDDIKNYYLE